MSATDTKANSLVLILQGSSVQTAGHPFHLWSGDLPVTAPSPSAWVFHAHPLSPPGQLSSCLCPGNRNSCSNLVPLCSNCCNASACVLGTHFCGHIICTSAPG